MNGAETLADTLLASGVTVCFANPGTSEMHFVSALDARPEMRCILCLFEGGVTGAADGYFRMSGQVAATLLHLAPGFANGIANLHNARKAGSGVMNVMGDHASYHLRHETPLKGDTEAMSRTVSHWTRKTADAGSVAQDGAAAVRAARSANGQIATLILPADAAWGEAAEAVVAAAPPVLPRPTAAQVAAAAEALKVPGAVLFLDGPVLRPEHAIWAARVQKATGCRLMTQYFAARIPRGEGALRLQRLSYRIDDAMADLKGVPELVLLGATRPAGFFAYPGKPSLSEDPSSRVTELCTPEMDGVWTLQALAAELGAAALEVTDADLQPHMRSSLPAGPITPAAIGQSVAALMPAGTVVVDEAITASAPLAAATEKARAHDWLNVTGGAIGFGLPVAVGAAVACPDRRVLALQADGSAMYTLQSFWTMAREELDVTVVILANRGYQILRLEMLNLGLPPAGGNARRMVDVAGPELDWVALAKGHGVEAIRVTDMDAFNAALEAGLGRKGPYLIEAVL
ncbi:acetolactate synthase large subunit [Tabrizicola sp. J26]|uniref:acetolactate synthase large subunit n=1 Tax=Alitabrizicola rongguiensis TaxID=2909234 RepID=UPI001F474DF0|nr:acetolactate synthase large subunit [Tabrizicola rongguiensis]MCF1708779.1 acetolactate synthase large subunit [Tabrizicola rongguiensis]